MARNENEEWILNFYRVSEISGAQFFARLAKFLPNGPITHDLTKHFADESMHAWYWTKAIDDCGYKISRMKNAYQDAYLEAAGLPVNIMEILALTNIFERRVVGQYSAHLKASKMNPTIQQTLKTIMGDEGWHIHWVTEALKKMEPEYGQVAIQETILRYRKADEEIYGSLVKENQERLSDIVGANLAIDA